MKLTFVVVLNLALNFFTCLPALSWFMIRWNRILICSTNNSINTVNLLHFDKAFTEKTSKKLSIIILNVFEFVQRIIFFASGESTSIGMVVVTEELIKRHTNTRGHRQRYIQIGGSINAY